MSSTFPTTNDTFTTWVDTSPSDDVDIARWRVLRAKAVKTDLEQTEYEGLCLSLATKLFNAQALNKLQDCIVAIESAIDGSVDSYLVQTAASLQTEINKFTFKGEWASGTAYAVKNVVSYNGEGFICIVANTGISPTQGDSNATWGLIAKQGIQGIQGDSGLNLIARGYYNASTAYSANDCVYYGTKVWYAKTSSTGQTPVAGTYWNIFMDPRDNKVNENVSILAVNWIGSSAPYTQEITVEKFTTNSAAEYTPVYSSTLATALLEKTAWNCVSKITSGTAKITLTCLEFKPATNITLYVYEL